MLSCLSLMHHTHVRVARDGEYHRTACGLSVADEFVESGLFADAATCDNCCRAIESRGRQAGTTAPLLANPKAVVRRLFDQVLNANEPDGLAALLGERLVTDFSAHRLNRLHEMFPSWRATIDDLIAEGESLVTRYRVDCTDAFGLTGAAGPTRKTNQTVIFRVAERRIVHVEAIVDDFGQWTDISCARAG